MWLALRSVKSITVDFLISSATSQSSSYLIVLMRLGRRRSNLIHIYNCGSAENQTRDLMGSTQTHWPLDQWSCQQFSINKNNNKSVTYSSQGSHPWSSFPQLTGRYFQYINNIKYINTLDNYKPMHLLTKSHTPHTSAYHR